MDKNKKSTDTPPKTGTAIHGEKETANDHESSKKMMDDKSKAQSVNGIHPFSGPSDMANKGSKGK
jgi:hypothetical protein